MGPQHFCRDMSLDMPLRAECFILNFQMSSYLIENQNLHLNRKENDEKTKVSNLALAALNESKDVITWRNVI